MCIQQMVRAIPEGFHSITPYLTVDNGATAIDFYKRAFEAKETSRLYDPDRKNIINAGAEDRRFNSITVRRIPT